MCVGKRDKQSVEGGTTIEQYKPKKTEVPVQGTAQVEVIK